MFKLDLFELINRYKKGHPDEKNDIENKISNLIKENKGEFEKFLATEEFDPHIQNLLKRCQENSEKKGIKKENLQEDNDFLIVRHKYERWLNFYVENNNVPEKNCEKIVQELIAFYAIDKFDVLLEILKIQDTPEYEAFKNMLRNYIRRYFALKIKNYYKSSNFKSLGFFANRKKKEKF